MKVLVLQDSSYFSELAVDFSGNEVTFGLPLTTSVTRVLKRFDVVVSCLDHDVFAHRTILLANFLGIPTVYVSDGVYDITNSIKNPAMAALGRRQLFPAAYSTIFCVGDRFSDWYSQFYPSVNVYSYFPKRAELRKSDISQEPKSVLFTTALKPYFDEVDFQSLVRECRLLLKDLSGSEYLIKMRVSDERLLRALPEYRKYNSTEGCLSDAVYSSSCVISTASTVLYSCFEYGVPHILLNHRNDEVLYSIDYSLNKGDRISFERLSQLISGDTSDREPNVGVFFSDYKYEASAGLVSSSSDFMNTGIRYLSRKVYRLFPPSFRKKIKRILGR